MKLIHYSAEPLSQVNSVTQNHLVALDGFKPNGVWFSVDDDWKRWCLRENFHPAALRHATEIVLSESANMLTLSTAEQLDLFTRQYSKPCEGLLFLRLEIDWEAVAKQYNGIIIAPYCGERRLRHRWYYGWACASGCIWNAEAIRELRKVEVTERIGN